MVGSVSFFSPGSVSYDALLAGGSLIVSIQLIHQIAAKTLGPMNPMEPVKSFGKMFMSCVVVCSPFIPKETLSPETKFFALSLASAAVYMVKNFSSSAKAKAPDFLEEMGKEPDLMVGNKDQLDLAKNFVREKVNICVLGDPGVGKTNLVKNLACQMREEEKDFKLFELTDFLAGTIFHGSWQGRVKELVDFFKQNPNYYLFVDEATLLT